MVSILSPREMNKTNTELHSYLLLSFVDCSLLSKMNSEELLSWLRTESQLEIEHRHRKSPKRHMNKVLFD